MVFSANQSVFSTAAAVTYIEGRYGSGAASAPADHYEPQDEGYFGPNFQFIPGPAFTAPTITGQPQGQTNAVGATASFTVTATGATPLAYQWYKSVAGGPWSVISGATNSTFSLQPLALSDAGDYTVVVTNNYGTTNSAAARLTVTSAAPGATVIFNNFSDASSLQLNGTATNTLTTDGWVLHLTAAPTIKRGARS